MDSQPVKDSPLVDEQEQEQNIVAKKEMYMNQMDMTLIAEEVVPASSEVKNGNGSSSEQRRQE